MSGDVGGQRWQVWLGDCLEVMRGMVAQSVDAIITDLPYGTTACSWDEVIPFEPMWEAVRHVLKPRGAFVTTASQPFTSKLIMSNLRWFRYEMIWQKDQSTGGLNANKMPLRSHENILVFYDSLPTYNPQMFDYRNSRFKLGETNTLSLAKRRPEHDVYGKVVERTSWTESGKRHPLSVVYCSSKLRSPNNAHITLKDHPTQKPVALYEYLIRTYTNENDTVLDCTMGSGTTGVAAMRTGRRFVGIELDADYFAIAEERIKNAAGEFVVTQKEAGAGLRSLFGWEGVGA